MLRFAVQRTSRINTLGIEESRDQHSPHQLIPAPTFSSYLSVLFNCWVHHWTVDQDIGLNLDISILPVALEHEESTISKLRNYSYQETECRANLGLNYGFSREGSRVSQDVNVAQIGSVYCPLGRLLTCRKGLV